MTIDKQQVSDAFAYFKRLSFFLFLVENYTRALCLPFGGDFYTLSSSLYNPLSRLVAFVNEINRDPRF